MRTFNEAAEEIQLEHKRRAVDQELKAVEKRVLEEVGVARVKQGTKIAETAVRAGISYADYKEPAGNVMIMIFEDGTIRAGYGFMPVGPRILTRPEFENLISTLVNRAATEPLNQELPAKEIVRRYFMEEVMKNTG